MKKNHYDHSVIIRKNESEQATLSDFLKNEKKP